MAEVFGVVAGAAGLATAFKELYKGLELLNTTRRNFRDAPRDLENLTEELQFLTDLVQVLIPREQLIKRKYPSGESMLKHCIKGCQDVVGILQDLQSKYSSTSTAKKAKRLLKLPSFSDWKADVDALRDRIVGVKQNLSLISGFGTSQEVQIEELLLITQTTQTMVSQLQPDQAQTKQGPISSSSSVSESEPSSPVTFTLTTFNARYARKRQKNCLLKQCSCRCHLLRVNHGLFWRFRYTPLTLLRQPCTSPVCTGGEYGLDFQVEFTRVGLNWAAEVQLHVLSALGGLGIRPSFTTSRVVSRGSGGFRALTKLMHEFLSQSPLRESSIMGKNIEKTRAYMQTLYKSDPTFPRHIAPCGLTYLEIIAKNFRPLGGLKIGELVAELFCFLAKDLRLLENADIPRLFNASLEYAWDSPGVVLSTLSRTGMDMAEADGESNPTMPPFGASYVQIGAVLTQCCKLFPTFRGMTPLHEAIALRAGQDTISYWIEKSEPDARNNYGQTPMHFAYASPSVVEQLIAAGHDANASDFRSLTPLHYALTKACQSKANFSEIRKTISVLVASGASFDLNDGISRFNTVGPGALDTLVWLVQCFEGRNSHRLAQELVSQVLPDWLSDSPPELLLPLDCDSEATVLDYLVRINNSLFGHYYYAYEDPVSLLSYVTSAAQLEILAKHFDLSQHHTQDLQGALTLLLPNHARRDNSIRDILDIIEVALRNGIHLDLADRWGHAPLHHALNNLQNERPRATYYSKPHDNIFVFQEVQLLTAVVFLLQKGARISAKGSRTCECSCSPDDCLPLAATCTIRESALLLPLYAILYVEMLREYGDSRQVRDALLQLIRRAKHQDLGITHTCCSKDGSRYIDYFRPPRISVEDRREIMDEEVDFIHILDDDMAELEAATLEDLVEIWFGHIKESFDECYKSLEIGGMDDDDTASEHSSLSSWVSFLDDPENKVTSNVLNGVNVLDFLRDAVIPTFDSPADRSGYEGWCSRGRGQTLRLWKMLDPSVDTSPYE